METGFTITPLTEEELNELGSHQLLLVPKPLYAPAIVKSYFLSRPWQFLTADKIAEETNLDKKNVRAICMRLVKEGWLTRYISKWKNKTHYYWFDDFKASRKT